MFYDKLTGKVLESNVTPHGSRLEVRDGLVFRVTSDNPSKRYSLV